MFPWRATAPTTTNKLACWNWVNDNLTCPVGSYPAGDTRKKLHDMAGNLWEWIGSFWTNDYNTTSALGTARVVRGGSWTTDTVNFLRGAFRYSCDPMARHYAIGFRCAKTP